MFHLVVNLWFVKDPFLGLLLVHWYWLKFVNDRSLEHPRGAHCAIQLFKLLLQLHNIYVIVQLEQGFAFDKGLNIYKFNCFNTKDAGKVCDYTALCVQLYICYTQSCVTATESHGTAKFNSKNSAAISLYMCCYYYNTFQWYNSTHLISEDVVIYYNSKYL